MEKEDKKIIIAFILFVLIVILTVINIITFANRIKNDKNKVEVVDTTYNTIILDSIKYNIIERDSIICHIKHDYEDSIENIKHLDDSSSIMLFEYLARERD